MNELLGILIPLLMSGQGIGGILQQLGGPGKGAAGMDGLSAMMGASAFQARMAFPMTQNPGTIHSAAEVLAERLGFNPYSGAGQGFAHAMGGLYKMAPGFFGNMLGVPDGRQFFSTIANNSAGISAASGLGQMDIFNPYSVMAAHERTRNLSRAAYDLGVRPDGGYNLTYSHGLNMDEMGRVTQRMLSSGIAYQDEKGNRIDPNDADKFKENMKKFGSKMNEAVASLSKITGSVDEALNVMDRLAGGNFLGGTQHQASDIANKAKKMAAAVRITSAIAGISPTETYAHMQGLMLSMSGGLGIDSRVAAMSGASNFMGNVAYNAMMGYNAWAASNPNASPFQREQGRMAAQGRAQAYASESASKIAAAIADNAGRFTEDEKKRMLSDLRSGNTEYAYRLARERLGYRTLTEYMNNPAMQVAARYRVSQSKDGQAFIEALDMANMEGQIQQTETSGATRMLGIYLSDMDTKLSAVSGGNKFRGARDSAVRARFIELATKQGLDPSVANTYSIGNLRRFLKNTMNGDDLAREENMASANAAIGQIDAMTMSQDEKSAAMARFENRMGGIVSNDKLSEIMGKIKNGASIESMIKTYVADPKQAREVMKEVLQDKITQEYADQLKKPLEDVKKSQDLEYTEKERMDAIARNAARADLERAGGFKKALGSRIQDAATDKDARAEFEKAARGDKRLSIGKDFDFSGTYAEAANRVISDMFGENLGNLKGDKLKDLNTRISKDIAERMQKEGISFREAYKQATGEKGVITEADKKAIGKEGLDAIKNLGDSDNLKRDSFYASAASVLDEEAGTAGAISEMRRLSAGKFGEMGQKKAFNRFVELAKKSGGMNMSDAEIDKLAASVSGGVDFGKDGSGLSAIKAFMKQGMPKGVRTDPNAGFFGMSQTGNANKAAMLMAALELRKAGGDIKALNLDDDTVAMIQKLDDTNAQKMNAFSDAIKTGGTKFRKEAVAGVSKQMDELRKSLEDVDIKTIREAFGDGAGSEAAKKKIEKALSARESTKDSMGMLEAIAGGKIGGKDALEVMKGGKLDDAKKAAGGNYEKDMLDIARKAGQNGSMEFDIGKGIGDLLGFMSRFSDGSAIKVKIDGFF